MRESTSAWLEPMLLEAELREVDVAPLMHQATMPGAEADSTAVSAIASYAPEGARVRGVDWIRFGALLRDALGWKDYPEFPSEEPI